MFSKRICILVCVVIIGVASGYRVSMQRPKLMRSTGIMKMSEEKSTPETSMVPVDLDNIGTAAGVFGGVLGLILAGPFGGIALAAVAKYVSKKENESGEALRGLGKTIIESYNFLLKINGKYNLTDKATEVVSGAVSSVGVSDSEALETVKKTYSTTTEKVKELNSEYDLVSKGKELVTAAATLSDAALEKVEELNAQYDFVETAKKAASTLVESIRNQVSESKKAIMSENVGKFSHFDTLYNVCHNLFLNDGRYIIKQ
eukprot:gene13995-29789_t